MTRCWAGMEETGSLVIGAPTCWTAGNSIDTLDYRGSTAGVMVNLATGTGRGGFAEGDVIRNIEDVRGTAFSDAIYGHAGDNDLVWLCWQ